MEIRRQTFAVLLVIIIAILTASCVSTEVKTQFRNTRWMLERIELDGTVVYAPESEEYWLLFTDDGMMSGAVFCNRLSAGFTAADGELFVGPIAMTRALCPPSDTEEAFTRAISSMTAYRIEGARLIITLSNDRGALYFYPAPEGSP